MSSREIEILVNPADVCPYKDGAPVAFSEGIDYFYNCDSCCTEETFKNVQDTSSIDVWAFAGCSNETEIIAHEECLALTEQVNLDLTCSPNNFLWLNSGKNALQEYPICAEFCNRWFDACKNVPSCTLTPHNYWMTARECTADLDPNMCRLLGDQFYDSKLFCEYFFSEKGKQVIIQAPMNNEFCLDPSQPDLTISYITKLNEEKLLLNQSYPVFDCSPSPDEITWWMWLLISLLGVGIIGGIGYFIYWFFVLRKKNSKEKEENVVDMNLNASGDDGSIEMEERKAEQENQAYVQAENGERDSIGDANDLQSQAASIQASHNPTIPPAMTPIPQQVNQHPAVLMPQQMPYQTMQSIQPIPMNTQQMMYGNPYATGGMPYNPQMQQGQMNPQMMNQQMYMNMQNSYQQPGTRKKKKKTKKSPYV
ncbi:unnamed protein product [Oikopleura dioica]|uniref:Folate receptor-like domain-containing protein n=1 Tax=Oikopleura dioica TaxID=34765 RepID=E4YLY9_OIKDI|nr:unnamed protein product [Oikopleura dioica]